MHLKCQAHDRRVIVTDVGSVVHRTRGTGELPDACNSVTLTIGGYVVGGRLALARQIANRRNRRVGRGHAR